MKLKVLTVVTLLTLAGCNSLGQNSNKSSKEYIGRAENAANDKGSGFLLGFLACAILCTTSSSGGGGGSVSSGGDDSSGGGGSGGSDNQNMSMSPNSLTLGEPDTYYQSNQEFEMATNTSITANPQDFKTNGSFKLKNGITLVKSPAVGDVDRSVSFKTPTIATRAAWRDSWTGLGNSMLIIDAFTLADGIRGRGYTVLGAALEIAPAADFYGLSIGLDAGEYAAGGVAPLLDQTDRNSIDYTLPTKFNVAIMGLSHNTPHTTEFTADELTTERSRALYTDLAGDNSELLLGDAVLVKRASNTSDDAASYIDNFVMVTDTRINDRLLMVGALNADNNTLADYSNYAGAETAMQNRFLVEDGRSPFKHDVYACTGLTTTSCENSRFAATTNFGTSLAAARVAGYATLLRHKFPTLNSESAAAILLDTATYDGLTCWDGTTGSCPANRYGQGRVNINAALSPIGELK